MFKRATIKAFFLTLYKEYILPLREKFNLQGQNVVLFGIAFVVVLLLAFSLVKSLNREFFSIKGQRDFNYRPFDLYDAENLCQQKMKFELKDKLLRFYVDDHSTRNDTKYGVYRIYFKADIGEMDNYEEYIIYCFVDSWDNELSYFRQMEDGLKEVKSTDLKFFK